MIHLSYILPCYKVEKYIQSCLDSIYAVSLPLDEFEVLCFDDCSPGETPRILDQLAKKYTNLRVVHSKENVGSGGGRNAMLQQAQGQYVWFMDPDDKVVPESVISLLHQARTNSLDVLLFNYLDISESEAMMGTGSAFEDTDVLDGLSFVDKVFGTYIVSHIGYPWRFLVRRDFLLLHNIRFPERVVFQDTVWMPKVLLYAHRVQASHEVGYLYWHHETSVIGSFDSIYPGKSIYTWCIIVPNQLLEFVSDLSQKQSIDMRYSTYAQVFRDFAQSHYLNKLPIFLGRTKREEREIFYHLLQKNGISSEVLAMANTITRMLLLPRIGNTLSNGFAFVYSLTHRK